MSKLTLKWRILLPIIITMTISISASVILTAVNSSRIVSELAQESLLNMAFNKANFVKSEFDQSLVSLRASGNILSSLADEQTVSNTTREDVTDMMANILINTPEMFASYVYFKPNGFDQNDEAYINTPLSDSSGRFNVYITRSNSSGDVNIEYLPFLYEEPEFVKALDSTGEMWIEPLIFTASDGKDYYMCSFLIPIIVRGKTVGVVGADVLFDNIQENFTNEKLFEDSDIFLISAGGDIPVHPNPGLRGKNISGTFTPAVEELMKSVMNPSSKGDMIQVYSQVKKTDAFYVAAPFTVGNSGNYWTVGIFVPVKEVMADVNSLVILTIIFGAAAIIIILAVSYLNVNSPSKKIAVLNDKVAEYSVKLSSISNDISSSGEVVAQGSMEQAASLQETSATMNETASMIEQNNKNTQQALYLTQNTAEAAVKGTSEINALIEFMNELAISSQTIANVIKAIESIAMQTNILSLNASVESARAGEAGKAFAIVAEEVRKLANRCNAEVKNTTAIIGNNINLTEQGLQNSQDVNKTFTDIMNSIKKVENLVSEITQASDEQSKGVQQINSALSQLEKATQQSAASAEENSASSIEMQNLSVSLEEVAHSLNQIIYGSKNNYTHE